MDELTTESDLPETSAPVVRYNEFPSDHYQMDVYVKAEEGEEEEGFWSSMNPFNVDDKVMKNISTFQQQILSGIWYGYMVLVNAGIYVMEQAFTFDLIGSMLSYVATFIGEIGGPYGIGQFMSFVLILTAGWLVYVFVQRQFRYAFGGLMIAAILSGFFTVYIQNSDTLLDWMNDSRNQLSNSVLNASTYNLDIKDEELKTNNVMYDGNISDETTVRYGLSRIRNLMHDLLIVKPYLLLEFGTTNLAVIGGAENSDDYTAASVQAGKDKVKSLLKAEPESAERKKFVTNNRKNSLFEPDKTNQRIVLALLVWIPAIAILGLTGFMAVQVQVYGIAFLITAAIGVFILMLSIFPALRSFAFQWVGRLLKFLLLSVAMTFGLVLMFSFVNIVYKVGGENNWNYVQTIIAVLIIVAAMVFLNKQLWGYKVMKQNMDRIKEYREKRVEEARERRRQQEQEEYGYVYVPAANGPGMQPVARRNYNGKTTERMLDAIQKQYQSSVHGPIKKKAPGTESADWNEQKIAAENRGNSSSQASIIDQIKKQQANDPDRIKKQPGSGERKTQSEVAAAKEEGQTNDSSLSNTNDIQKRIQGQQEQDSGRIKKQPKTPDHVKPSDANPVQSRPQEQLERAKARDRQEKESYQGNVISFPTRQTLQDQSMKEEDRQREKQLKELLKGNKEVATTKSLNQDQIDQVHKHQSNSDLEG